MNKLIASFCFVMLLSVIAFSATQAKEEEVIVDLGYEGLSRSQAGSMVVAEPGGRWLHAMSRAEIEEYGDDEMME